MEEKVTTEQESKRDAKEERGRRAFPLSYFSMNGLRRAVSLYV